MSKLVIFPPFGTETTVLSCSLSVAWAAKVPAIATAPNARAPAKYPARLACREVTIPDPTLMCLLLHPLSLRVKIHAPRQDECPRVTYWNSVVLSKDRTLSPPLVHAL